MKFAKHLVKCTCFLSIFRDRNLDEIPQHSFVVVSEFDDEDNVLPSYVQCNNCGVIHKVTDICKSEIIAGKDHLSSIQTIDEIASSLPSSLIDTLRVYDLDVTVWQEVALNVKYKIDGSTVILTKEVVGDDVVGKKMVMKDGKFVISSYNYKFVI